MYIVFFGLTKIYLRDVDDGDDDDDVVVVVVVVVAGHIVQGSRY